MIGAQEKKIRRIMIAAPKSGSGDYDHVWIIADF